MRFRIRWENMFFFYFGGKTCFFLRENTFSDFARKIHISSFRGITRFWFLAEKCVFGFRRENVFSGLAGKRVFRFRRKITIF